MPRRGPSLPSLKTLPPLLSRLVRAAQVECPPGHADALATFIEFALRKVPARGIFDPGSRDEPEMFSTIDAVARAHFQLDAALAAWHNALNAANLAMKPRDAIESTALRVQSESDTAYFYAGLAFGLVFAGPYTPRS